MNQNQKKQEAHLIMSKIDPCRIKTAKKLKVDKNFIPCPVEADDELYQNGYFVFNITKMHEYIERHSSDLDLIQIEVEDFPESFSSINDSHIDSVDVSKPVILAEISPGNYNLIDGNHRKEKARKIGISRISAYKLNVEQHIKFLTEKDAYYSYVNYWNGKLK
jgi:hypothetical protein